MQQKDNTVISLHFRELVACPGLVFLQQLCLMSAVGAEIALTTPVDLFIGSFMCCSLLGMSLGFSVPLICSPGKVL